MNSICKSVYVGGERVEFPRLAVEDVYALAEAVKAEHEQVAKQLAKETNLNPLDLYNVVLQIRQTTPTLNQLLALTATPKWAVEMLHKSLAKAGKDKAEAVKLIDAMGSEDRSDVAASLILNEREEAKPDSPPLS